MEPVIKTQSKAKVAVALGALALAVVVAGFVFVNRDLNTEAIASTTTAVNEDFGSCNSDAHAYCSGLYATDWKTYAATNGYTTASWKYAVVDCLGKHRDQTSQACDDSLDRRQVLNEELNTACAADRGTYCAGVKPIPGSEPQVDCLKANYAKLSVSCAAAVDAHEAAKPTSQQ